MADILSRTIRATVTLEESPGFDLEQEYYKQAVTFTKEHHARIVLDTAMAAPQSINMSGITTGKSLMLSTDREVLVGINDTSNLITVSESGMIALVGSFTDVYVQNESANYKATIEVVLTD